MSGEKIIRALDAIPDEQLLSAISVYERRKLLLSTLPRVIAGLLALICVVALADTVRHNNNPFFSHERLISVLSREQITKRDQIIYIDTHIEVTEELSDILDVQNWTRAKRFKQGGETPILAIEYTDFQFIYIYGNYACLVDNDGFLPYAKVYYTFSHDITQELVDYLETCAEKVFYGAKPPH